VHTSRALTAAAERSRWLAELAQAIDDALRLARSSSAAHTSCAGAEHLKRRLEAVRDEVEGLRRGRRDTRPIEIDPLWTSLFPWQGRPKL